MNSHHPTFPFWGRATGGGVAVPPYTPRPRRIFLEELRMDNLIAWWLALHAGWKLYCAGAATLILVALALGGIWDGLITIGVAFLVAAFFVAANGHI